MSSPAAARGPEPEADPAPDRAGGTDPRRGEAIAAELAVLLDVHLAELRSRGVDETVLAPIESELRRYGQARRAG